MGPELGERKLLRSGPLTEEGGDLGKGRRGRVDLEKLKEASRRTFGVPTNVKAHAGPPTRAEILHPMRNGAATDPKFHESGRRAERPSRSATDKATWFAAKSHALFPARDSMTGARDRGGGRAKGGAVR